MAGLSLLVRLQSQPGFRARQPGLRARQPGLRARQPGLRARQPGVRARQPVLRWTDRWIDGAMAGCQISSFYRTLSPIRAAVLLKLKYNQTTV